MYEVLQHRLGALLLAAGMAFASAEGAAASGSKAAMRGTGKMQVEEPSAGTSINPASESKAWQRSHAQGLTAEQKRAFRERKEKMGEMIALIKEKRLAMAGADPDERAVLARELHTLILEKDSESRDDVASARTKSGEATGKKDGNQRASDEASRQKQELLKLVEERVEELRKAQKEKSKSNAGEK